MRTRALQAVSFMTLFIIVGCTTADHYQIPSGSPAELARIRNSEKLVGVMSIDDKKSMSMSQFVFNNYPEYITIAPGKHRILAVAGGYQNAPQMWLWLVAEPGKEYLLKKEISQNGYVRFWFEDGFSGKPIGGLVGSADEPHR